MFRSDKYCVVVLIFFSKCSRFFCVLSGKEVFTVLRNPLNGFVINAVRLAMLLLRVRFAATCHNGGQIDAKIFILLSSGKISDFYATYQIGKDGKTLSGQCFVRFVKYSVSFEGGESL